MERVRVVGHPGPLPHSHQNELNSPCQCGPDFLRVPTGGIFLVSPVLTANVSLQRGGEQHASARYFVGSKTNT